MGAQTAKWRIRITALFLCAAALSCSGEKKVMKAFRFGEYQKVIDYYTSAIKKNPEQDNGKNNYYIAEAYRLSNRIGESEPYYKKAMAFTEKRDEIILSYVEALKANEKYDDAMRELKKERQNITDENTKARFEQRINALAALDRLAQQKSYYHIKNLTALNTPFSEYAPVYLNDQLYFTGNRGGGKMYAATGTPFTELYKVNTKGAKVDAKTVKSLPERINSSGANEGCATFSPNGKVMVFARGNTGKRKGNEDVDLYISYFRRGKWTEAKPININQPDTWESTPAFGPDGRTLYFASNRKGGNGGTDLYSCRASLRGRFSRVRNLGSDVNTAGNELFPFVSKEGNLFFASDGHPGYGMLDLFEVHRKDGKNEIRNMGKPINSNKDDFGIFLFKPNKGFFTSNRKGGQGDDDIYTFVNNDPNLKIVNYQLAGVTMTPTSDNALTVLPNVKVTLLDKNGEVMQQYGAGSDGKFLFRVYENEDYNLVGEADGYLIKRQPYTTRGKSVDRETLTELVSTVTLDTVMVLEKLQKDKVFVLDNIYFDFGKYNIRPDAARELDKLVELLNDNPEIKIEMGSHTDSVDTHEYNIRLSQQRAESTVDYLVSQGIDPDRLTAKGYGEEKPIAPNSFPDGTDNPEGRQKNRRTEFKIVEIDAQRRRKKTPEEGQDDESFEEDRYFND